MLTTEELEKDGIITKELVELIKTIKKPKTNVIVCGTEEKQKDLIYVLNKAIEDETRLLVETETRFNEEFRKKDVLQDLLNIRYTSVVTERLNTHVYSKITKAMKLGLSVYTTTTGLVTRVIKELNKIVKAEKELMEGAEFIVVEMNNLYIDDEYKNEIVNKISILTIESGEVTEKTLVEYDYYTREYIQI